MAKRPAKDGQVNQASGAIVGRPHLPHGYGVPKDKKGLLPWTYVSERMAQAMNYWVITVGPDGHPYATPIWGLWLDDQLYLGISPETRRDRNLAANPAVCVHLESGTDVVIMHSKAELHIPDHTLAVRLADASKKKYGYGPKPEEYEANALHIVRPRLVLAWKAFPKDATRWEFPVGG